TKAITWDEQLRTLKGQREISHPKKQLKYSGQKHIQQAEMAKEYLQQIYNTNMQKYTISTMQSPKEFRTNQAEIKIIIKDLNIRKALRYHLIIQSKSTEIILLLKLDKSAETPNQSKLFKMIFNAPWYVRNDDIEKTLGVSSIKETIKINNEKDQYLRKSNDKRLYATNIEKIT
ncbi:hypothetical protein V1478_005083, partial [Vespula squamosa]